MEWFACIEIHRGCWGFHMGLLVWFSAFSNFSKFWLAGFCLVFRCFCLGFGSVGWLSDATTIRQAEDRIAAMEKSLEQLRKEAVDDRKRERL